jgi:hypothetical protein
MATYMRTSYRSRAAWCGLLFFFLSSKVPAQQFSLYGTGSLWDSFENPAQSPFELNESRQFASNFFVPNSGVNLKFNGPAQVALKNILLYSNGLSISDLDVDARRFNRLNASENSYLLMLRLFKTVDHRRELGFSWQTRAESHGKLHNQALIVFKTANEQGINGIDEYLNRTGPNQLRATDLQAQAYHQIGFTFREQYNQKFSYGIKLSYLSGIAHNSVKVRSGELNIDPASPDYRTFTVGGVLRSSYYDNIAWDDLRPNFRNPGMSLTLSSNMKLRDGYNVLTNLKDIGFIRWSNDSYRNGSDLNINTLDDAEDQLNNIQDVLVRERYTSVINGKAEALISKNFGAFKLSALLSKSLFNNSGDIVLMNSFRYKILHIGASGAYNLNDYFQFGGQLMLKSPNVEFFMGTDNLFQSYKAGVLLTDDQNRRKERLNEGIKGASAYLGFSLKFGRIVSDPQNENYIPGINHRIPGTGFLNKIFGKRD